ncbi:transcription antitermination protein [Haloferax sp. DFSO60]|uniref:transcription antitermination protein n=1 Tax=Haloferax sp. DFSO60 TaxID=3388652 RepID=UPI00397888EE
MTSFLDSLRGDHETPLSRLGSSKALYALTAGDMNADAVRAAAAADASAAANLFDEWTAAESSGDAATHFADIAETARSHLDTVNADDESDAPQLYDVLAEFETTDERLGGALARVLVSLKATEQMVGFFIGDADPKSANTFRTLKSDLQDQLEALAEAVDELVDDEALARTAADAVIQSAYDEYVETLEGMGIKPKNVC